MEPYWKSKKRPFEVGEAASKADVNFRFKILLPNGICVVLVLRSPPASMSLQEFLKLVKDKYELTLRNSQVMKPARSIQWDSGTAYVEDANGNNIRKFVEFEKFKPFKCHILQLHVSDVFSISV